MRTELRTYFLTHARRQGIVRPNLLWRQAYDAVDGGRVIDFIWESAAISAPSDRADRRRVMRALRNSDQVREARVVIRSFLGDLKKLHEGDWNVSDIAQVQRGLKVEACHVYPCKSADA